MNKNDLMIKLIEERNYIQNQIYNSRKINEKNFIIRTFIKSGIAIDYAAPYIFSFLIMLNIASSLNKTPFITDEYIEIAQTEIVDLSNGMHTENDMFLNGYDKRSIEYSTGWKKNEYGLFERTITKYMINNIDISDKEKIFSMSKEELDDALIKLSVDTFSKESLNENDQIYSDDVIIITNLKDSDITRVNEETNESNFITTIFYLIFASLLGRGIDNFSKVIFHDNVKNRLKKLENDYRYIDKKELERLKEIIKIKEDNLSLLYVKKKVK